MLEIPCVVAIQRRCRRVPHFQKQIPNFRCRNRTGPIPSSRPPLNECKSKRNLCENGYKNLNKENNMTRTTTKKSKTNNLSFFSIHVIRRIWFKLDVDGILRIRVRSFVHGILQIRVRSFVDAILRIGVKRLDRQETSRFHLESKMKKRNNDAHNVSGAICLTTLEMQGRDISHF